MSCAVLKTPAWPATPPMRRVVGSWTVPRRRWSKSGLAAGLALDSSSWAVGASVLDAVFRKPARLSTVHQLESQDVIRFETQQTERTEPRVLRSPQSGARMRDTWCAVMPKWFEDVRSADVLVESGWPLSLFYNSAPRRMKLMSE